MKYLAGIVIFVKELEVSLEFDYIAFFGIKSERNHS